VTRKQKSAPGGGDRAGQLVAVQAPAGHDEHAGLQVPGPVREGDGEGVPAAAGAACLDRGDGVGAALGQGHHQHLRERAGPGLHRGVAEELPVGRGAGGIELDAVQRHQPPPGQVRPGGRQLRARHGDPLEQHPQRLAAQPLPGLRQRGGRRYVPFPFPDRQPGKALHQLPHDLLIRIAVKQREREHEIHHDPGGQQPFPLLPAPRLRQHVLNQLPRDQPGQHAKRDPVRQRRPRRNRPGNLLGHEGTIPRAAREKEIRRVIHIPPGVSHVEMWKPHAPTLKLTALSYRIFFLRDHAGCYGRRRMAGQEAALGAARAAVGPQSAGLSPALQDCRWDGTLLHIEIPARRIAEHPGDNGQRPGRPPC
jgi:hypothetical protein